MKSAKERLFVQSIRIGIYFACLFLIVLQFLIQRNFYNWSLLRNFYLLCFFGLSIQIIPLWNLEKFFNLRKLLAFSFFADVILISAFIFTTELNQSIFLFMYLINIILAGLVFHSQGAIAIASASSIGFTIATVLGPEIKSMSFIFLILLNNFSFFVVAWLSGYLAEQLSFFSDRLEIQSMSLTAIRRLNELIIETIPSGLLTIKKDGQILQSNPGATSVFGSEELIGKSLFLFLPEMTTIFDLSHYGKKQEFTFNRNGESCLLSIQILQQITETFVDETFLVIVEDLTQVKKLEFAVRHSEKMAAIGQLAAGIAHEIRNPLTGISGSIEMLSQTSRDEDDKKLTKIILKEIDRLNNLISEFLDFAKPDKPPVDKIDLSLLLKECVNSLLVQAINKVQVDISVGQKIMIRGHQDKLKQAFLNIIINSLQAMENSENSKLMVLADVHADCVQVRVKDNGCGMNEETKQRIFEAFYTTKKKGTGLGLAITHKILQSHEAQIAVKSELGLGTEFLISFPKI